MAYYIVAAVCILASVLLMADTNRAWREFTETERSKALLQTPFREITNIALVSGVSGAHLLYLFQIHLYENSPLGFLTVINPPISFADKGLYWLFAVLWWVAMTRVLFGTRPLGRKLLTILLGLIAMGIGYVGLLNSLGVRGTPV